MKNKENKELDDLIDCNVFFDQKTYDRAKKLEQDIKDGKVKSVVIAEGDERFKGFKKNKQD